MDTGRICFLREILVTDRKGQTMRTLEFSYDEGSKREPHFFGVPTDDLAQTHQLYVEWGGTRAEGYRRGTTVKRPELRIPRDTRILNWE